MFFFFTFFKKVFTLFYINVKNSLKTTHRANESAALWNAGGSWEEDPSGWSDWRGHGCLGRSSGWGQIWPPQADGLRGGERSFVGAVGGSVSVRTHCLITGKWGLNQDVILVIYAQLRFPTSLNLYKLIKSAAWLVCDVLEILTVILQSC